MFRSFNANSAFFPAKGFPLQFVDFAAPQADHRCQQKDFQLLLLRRKGKFTHSIRNQCLNIHFALITHTFALIERHVVKRQLLRHVHKPEKLPFNDVAFYKRESMRYQSKVDIEALISDAVRELSLPAQQEQLKIFLLATMVGLRRGEIDKLQWEAFRWKEGTIRIETTEHSTPKTSDSAGDVPIDKELAALFRGWHAKATGLFVIEGDGEPRTDTSYAHYRAQRHFDALIKCLKSKGVTALKPLHELRKEFGSQLCAKYGIYAASRALRHADITITAQHYVDQKERVTFGMGDLLTLPNNSMLLPRAPRAIGASSRSSRRKTQSNYRQNREK